MNDPMTFPDRIVSRALSFGTQAAAYAEERPGYPDEAILWALEPVRSRTALRVLDLGAGTGKLTEALLRQAVDVVAVEPDPNMLSEFRQRFPEVKSLAGSAEKIPLPDGAVDAILVGQAMHWFDLDRAVPEMARVLTTGGVVAGLWNLDDDSVAWVRGLNEASGGCATPASAGWPESTRLDGRVFSVVEHARFAHSQRRTAESLAATLATRSGMLILSQAGREAAIIRIIEYLRSVPETAHGEFDLPLVTGVLRARLAPDR
ncbi:class I SAM-dependent methyltransferase [Microtetraspora fusca]|uniref:class I SAM-dependent methyltransferase n=1 Tax=Microtetraspora fusca TaxID=1997 RepID=UPI000A4687D2|nr:class I SAM-dependent methyltransferase [Microtetraspora fusca]